jgi:hypothetical protein
MKRFLTLVLLVSICATSVAQTKPGLRVGTAAVEINPDVVPFQLRSGPSKYIHDPLHVRAVAFQNGEGRAVIALIDAIGYGRERSDIAKHIVAKRTGWKPEEMLVSATHTHTAPKGGDTSPGRIAYEKKRFDGIVAALTQAIESLEPANVGFSSDEETTEVLNRRWHLRPGAMDKNPLGGFDKVRMNPPRDKIVSPAGPTDPEVCVIYARTKRGKPLGLIANYALHYVGGIPKVTEENGKIVGMASADYFGEFARIMPHRVGGSRPPTNFVAFINNGSSGDINNIDFTRTRAPRAPFEQIRIVAGKTADAAWRAVKKIETYDDNPLIAVRQREITLKYRVPSAEQVAAARKIQELPRKQRAVVNKRADPVSRRTLLHAGSDRPADEKVLIQAIRIGDQAVVTMPFEVLVEIGLEIKEKSPFPHTMFVELANGSYGYLPPAHQIELGGYESWLGVSKFQVNASVILTRNLLQMLAELRAL